MPPIRNVDTAFQRDLPESEVRLTRRRSARRSLTSATSISAPVRRSTSSEESTFMDDPVEAGAKDHFVRRSQRLSTGSLEVVIPPPRRPIRCLSARSGRQEITIKGQVLKPTDAFDTMWRFATERKAIDDKRRAGLPPPWTDDKILREYAFCNPYRVLDRVSQYLITEVIERGSQKPDEIVFRVVLFNTFTRIETWELLQRELGPLTWKKYNRDAYVDVLRRAKSKGMSLYTGAFQKTCPSLHSNTKDIYLSHLTLMEMLMNEEFPAKLQQAGLLSELFEWLFSFPSMGDFNAYQLLLNLSYTPVLNFHDDDFVIAGIGAHIGLERVFGTSYVRAKEAVRGIDVEIIRYLTETQSQHFKRLGLDFTYLGPERLPLRLCDIEHLLCEIGKYCRVKKTPSSAKRRFHPSSTLPPKPRLPKAWAHPDRKIRRIGPIGPPIKEKRYVVESIAGKRNGKNGVEYLVYWWGYAAKDATWEQAWSLIADAPAAVKEYEASKQKTLRFA